MIFDSDGNSGEFVELVAEELNYLGPKDLTQYFIRQTSMNKTIKGSIKVEVVLGRRLLGTVLTVYIPTILLIFIAHTTNYFKSFFFEAVVSVNLTVMLVNECLFSSNHGIILSFSGAGHHVHLCLSSSAQDILHQDGGRLAHLQSDDSILWGKLSNKFSTLTCCQVILHTAIDSLRSDEGREINHHGKPRKVGGLYL